MSTVVSIDQPVGHDSDALLAAIVDSSSDAIVGKTLNSIITTWNPAAQQMFGYTAEEAIGQSILMLVPENRYSEETEIIERIRRGERVETFETIRRRKDGVLIPVSLTISPIRNSKGEIVGASKIARDISATKESERRIRLLMREVNHRVKNQFAVILAMIRESGKRSASVEEFEERIRDRIMALSRSHDLLVNAEWSGASLFELVQEQLVPFGHEAQIALSGPLLTVKPNAVQCLGMAFHELATNSAKYGALSSDVGHVSVAWKIVTNAEGQKEFSVSWEETSVPVEAERTNGAKHIGFGSVVLQRVTPETLSGSASTDRRPGYLRWTLNAPVCEVVLSSFAEEHEHGVAEIKD
ncbi:PAS domain S-box-containing protein [Mesorhizobium sp. J18]|uniref:PAS domain S-box protein n=1 Tax=Mesorhizobium sp. J18 TaxID=935263 RepID=UPI00119AE88A|nr:PAS domain S-box protein [Mesorhizobium sp. J18]TWG94185.1 PAS domain S-box-containing protein [Mesorhizobium sp. J18]